MSAAFSSASLAFVVAALLPWGPALSPESRHHLGRCFQPWMLCCCVFSMWDVQDLEGLGGASLRESVACGTESELGEASGTKSFPFPQHISVHI